ncbi:TIGR02301 family protein [Breoghania sp. L-A4]|uniref:TIGR02301 family protein n=1 Tax=Breoghania sp. L-A4 TaxID=2304600 RepID=UPI000E358B43|nr:TIGR02301 family protein [Breoghania sp. L-A4]AXS39561.1 TIGR02301 family protein [Breoghania sp. L-A4]
MSSALERPRACAHYPAMTRTRFVLVAAMIAVLAAPGARHSHAQSNNEQPPYEDDLMRLSEVLGAIHYLRALCGATDGTVWRDRMNALLEVEADEPARRHKLVDRFNRGYRSFASVYRECTPSARSSTERYMTEGQALADEIATRYSR